MAKVYVITAGEYSDYHICAVALDPQKAEQLKRVFDPSDYTGARIEEWDTEKHDDYLAGRTPYYVVFLENGDVFNAGKRDWNIEYFEPGITETTCRLSRGLVPALRVELYADNGEAAIKIASEKRAKYLAEKEGIA